jgi:hypothetical protein
MRRLDWFLAAVVAGFLLAVAVIETTSLSLAMAGFGAAHAGGVSEVAMRRLVTCPARPPILGVEPQ